MEGIGGRMSEFKIENMDPKFLYTWKGTRHEDEADYHCHDHIEVAFVLSGVGKYRIEDEIFDYKFASDFGLNSQEDLFNQPIDNVSNSINEIVNVEGPVHVNEVVKRVKDSCHIKRAGSKMKKQVL